MLKKRSLNKAQFSYYRKRLKDEFVYRSHQLIGNKDYAKFIIVSRSRTGSTLLNTLLNSHRFIICGSEEFGRLEGRSTVDIWERIFSKKPKKIRWVGFKIFYYHPLDSSDKSVWDLITQDPDIKIIHLVRRNLLRTSVSRAIAEKTGNFSKDNVTRIRSSEDKAVSIPYEEMKATFEETTKWENDADELLRDHQMIKISYEALTTEQNQTIAKICSFLDVEDLPLRSPMKRQNAESLRDLLINYEDLAAKFKGSAFEHLFEQE